MKKLSAAFFASTSLLIVACGDKPAPQNPATGETTAAVGDGEAVAAQIARGQELYGARCARCHGDGGQGTEKGPKVVGEGAFPLDPRPGAKRNVPFRTAADVFAWASKAMPGDEPGTVSTEDMLAIFAFDLTANGVKLTAPLDGPAAAAIVLHP